MIRVVVRQRRWGLCVHRHVRIHRQGRHHGGRGAVDDGDGVVQRFGDPHVVRVEEDQLLRLQPCRDGPGLLRRRVDLHDAFGVPDRHVGEVACEGIEERRVVVLTAEVERAELLPVGGAVEAVQERALLLDLRHDQRRAVRGHVDAHGEDIPRFVVREEHVLGRVARQRAGGGVDVEREDGRFLAAAGGIHRAVRRHGQPIVQRLGAREVLERDLRILACRQQLHVQHAKRVIVVSVVAHQHEPRARYPERREREGSLETVAIEHEGFARGSEPSAIGEHNRISDGVGLRRGVARGFRGAALPLLRLRVGPAPAPATVGVGDAVPRVGGRGSPRAVCALRTPCRIAARRSSPTGSRPSCPAGLLRLRDGLALRRPSCTRPGR